MCFYLYTRPPPPSRPEVPTPWQDPEPTPPSSAWEINNFIATRFAGIMHTIPLPLADGSVFSWDVCRADLLIQRFAADSDTFRDVLKHAVEAPHPLSDHTASQCNLFRRTPFRTPAI